jgi:hypothetical protein
VCPGTYEGIADHVGIHRLRMRINCRQSKELERGAVSPERMRPEMQLPDTYLHRFYDLPQARGADMITIGIEQTSVGRVRPCKLARRRAAAPFSNHTTVALSDRK